MQDAENTYLPWHDGQFRQLAAARRHLPHAMLVHGPRGVGKASFARALAKALLCERAASGVSCGNCPACGWFDSGNHPDFRLIEPAGPTQEEEDGEGSSKTSVHILIEQIRDLAGFINVSSHRGGAKVVIIDPAEALNVNAANALLKSLEEPPENTYFILVTHRIHFLLPTIRSRCRLIALTAPEAEAGIAWLAAQGAREPALALAHAGNAPLLARELEAGEYWQHRDTFLAQVAVRRFDGLAAAEQLFDFPLREVVGWLQKWTYDLVSQRYCGRIRYNPDRATAITALARQIEPVAMLRFHRHVLSLQRVIDHPLNPRLVVEQLLLDYGLTLTNEAAAPSHAG